MGATTLETDSASFNGTISGSSVTLTFSHGFGSTLSGQLDGKTLRLSVPQADGTIQVETYQPGRTDEYNSAVQVVQASAAQLEQQAASNASVASEESAASAAAAAAQQQAASDQQAEQRALASLEQDTNFDQQLSSLSADVKQTQVDLDHTRSDAKAGGGDNCVNASSVVYNDAASTVYNDAASSLSNDAIQLSIQFATAQTDIDNVQSAEQLGADGVAADASSAGSVDAAKSAIAAAKATANADIDKVNEAVAAAYKVANSIATGPCAGTGPGDPPDPMAHI
ncbi:hypothetical protein SAMN04515671_1456 [Nakamurella panacisegetis]|uniref:Uncharacterized protein n=1 Tax=Nakamurella panacisegetis TaxID=1090615 RepID=A0A1H0KWE1_9ACTN|nr:hypothetical protein [Nakamurella panacisegetis]SDO60258.1 hypothetical protein SAMN04515671_1456 [Nakamurella panacisegetis]